MTKMNDKTHTVTVQARPTARDARPSKPHRAIAKSLTRGPARPAAKAQVKVVAPAPATDPAPETPTLESAPASTLPEYANVVVGNRVVKVHHPEEVTVGAGGKLVRRR